MNTREIRYRKSRRENFLEVPPRSGSSSQDLLIREWKKIESYSERVRGLDLFTKFPGGSDGKKSACNAGDLALNPWVGKIPWRREWLLTPVFLAGEFNGQRSHGVKKSRT